MVIKETGISYAFYCRIRICGRYACCQRSSVASTDHKRSLRTSDKTNNTILRLSVSYCDHEGWVLSCQNQTHQHQVPFYSLHSTRWNHQPNLLPHRRNDSRHLNQSTTCRQGQTLHQLTWTASDLRGSVGV